MGSEKRDLLSPRSAERVGMAAGAEGRKFENLTAGSLGGFWKRDNEESCPFRQQPAPFFGGTSLPAEGDGDAVLGTKKVKGSDYAEPSLEAPIG
jgi:hypothetical protein